MNKTELNKNLFAKYTAHLPSNFHFPQTDIEQRIFAEYGALFVARCGAVAPRQVVFKSEREVAEFQSSVEIEKATVGDFEIELQGAAMKNLKNAVREAAKNELTITPRAADSARRNFQDTVDLWASRVNPALIHWTREGKLTDADAEKIRASEPFDQVAEILKHEANEIFFSKDLRKSILYSVAPPGASQHLSLLALDINEYDDARVRKILAKHFWYQTVVSDLPHFTFLGASESELPDLGLKKIETENGRAFWIPNI